MARGKCLDVGTGDGRLFAKVALKSVGPHDAIDIKDFREVKPANVTFHKCDAERFKTSKKYDTIIMNHTLEHMENPIGVLKKFHGMLKPGGRMLIAVPNSQGWLGEACVTSAEGGSPHLHIYTVKLLKTVAMWLKMDFKFIKTRLKVPFSATAIKWVPWLEKPLNWLEYYLGRIAPLRLNTQIFVVVGSEKTHGKWTG
jgi:SAM-dependent methyltransferase